MLPDASSRARGPVGTRGKECRKVVPWSGPLLDTQSWTSTAAANGTTSQHTTSCHTIPIPTLQLSAHASSPRSITHLLHDTPHNAPPQHTTLHHVIPCYSTPCHVTPSHATCVRLTDNCLLPTTYDPIPTAIRPATLPPSAHTQRKAA